jgi:hypothetical protein
MAVQWDYSSTWEVRSLNLRRGIGPLPDPNQFRVLLFNGSTLTKTMSKAAMLAAELLQQNGYARQPYNPTNATYNATTQRAELPRVTANYTGAGASLQWDAAAVLAIAVPLPQGQSRRSMLATDILTIANHGLTNGEEVTVSTTDTFAGGLEGSLIYYAKVVTANAIQLCSDAATASVINITNAGVGTHHLRYAKGDIVFFGNFPGSQTIGDGVTESLPVDWKS